MASVQPEWLLQKCIKTAVLRPLTRFIGNLLLNSPWQKSGTNLVVHQPIGGESRAYIIEHYPTLKVRNHDSFRKMNEIKIFNIM